MIKTEETTRLFKQKIKAHAIIQCAIAVQM